MKFRQTLIAAAMLTLGGAANAAIMLGTVTSNNGDNGPNYKFSITQTAGTFTYLLTIDPWNAEALGVFIDLGDVDLPGFTDGDVADILPPSEVELFAVDTTGSGCGQGCNINGDPSNPDLGDGEWEMVFRLADQGFDSIQTFSWTTPDFGLTESDFKNVAFRAQVLCSGDDLLPGDEQACGGSDKSNATFVNDPGPDVDCNLTDDCPVPPAIPEPGSLLLLGAGLLGFAAMRRRRQI